MNEEEEEDEEEDDNDDFGYFLWVNGLFVRFNRGEMNLAKTKS